MAPVDGAGGAPAPLPPPVGVLDALGICGSVGIDGGADGVGDPPPLPPPDVPPCRPPAPTGPRGAPGVLGCDGVSGAAGPFGVSEAGGAGGEHVEDALTEPAWRYFSVASRISAAL